MLKKLIVERFKSIRAATIELGRINLFGSSGFRVGRAIGIAGKFDMLPDRDVQRHVPAPAVESTETWCIAAFRTLRRNPEYLNGLALCQD